MFHLFVFAFDNTALDSMSIDLAEKGKKTLCTLIHSRIPIFAGSD